MFKLEQERIPVGFSADCVGPFGRPRHLRGAWEETARELMMVSSKGKMVLCEIPLFKGAAETLTPAATAMGLAVGYHGKIGTLDKAISVVDGLVHNGIDRLVADEKEMADALVRQTEAVYGLVHAERFWQLVSEKGQDDVISRLSSSGKLMMIENGAIPGSFERAVAAVELSNHASPGRFALMIDWLHLLKDVGRGVIDGNFIFLCDRAVARATEALGGTNFVFGEHGAFGLRPDDSHNLEAIGSRGDSFEALRRLYGVGESFRERLLVKVIETQYEAGDYLKLDLGLVKFLRQRNRQLVYFLVEELGWI